MSWDPSPTPAKRDAAVVKAEREGFEVVEGASNQLLLDLDDGREINQAVYEKVCEMYGKPKIEEWASKSGRGRHIVLTFNGSLFKKRPSFGEAEATALECALGSDPIRAVLNVRRVQLNSDNPRVLFRPTDKVPPELLAEYAGMTQEQQRQVFTASDRLERAIS